MRRSPIRVMLLDGQPVVRIGIRYLFQENIDIEITAEASICEELQQYLFMNRECLPEVIIMDLWVSGVSTLRTISYIKSKYPTVKILIYTSKDENIFGIPVFQLGASGYVSRETEVRFLEEAIRLLVAGEYAFSEKIRENIRFQEENQGRIKEKRISAQELRVLIMIAEGLKTREIASRLGVTDKTVESQKESLKAKVNAENTTRLSQIAFLYVCGGGS